jgi:hypothetical protein
MKIFALANQEVAGSATRVRQGALFLSPRVRGPEVCREGLLRLANQADTYLLPALPARDKLAGTVGCM